MKLLPLVKSQIVKVCQKTEYPVQVTHHSILIISSRANIYSNVQVFLVLLSGMCIPNRTLPVGQTFLIGTKCCRPIDSNLRDSIFTALRFYSCTHDQYGES